MKKSVDKMVLAQLQYNTTQIARVGVVTPFKVIQGHWFSTNRKHVCDFLL